MSTGESISGIRQLRRQKARAAPAPTMHSGPERAECAECHVTALLQWAGLVSQPALPADCGKSETQGLVPRCWLRRMGKLTPIYSEIRKGLWHFLRGSWQIKSSIRYILELKKIMHIKLCPILTQTFEIKEPASYLLLNSKTDICLTGNKSQTNKEAIRSHHYRSAHRK